MLRSSRTVMPKISLSRLARRWAGGSTSGVTVHCNRARPLWRFRLRGQIVQNKLGISVQGTWLTLAKKLLKK